LVDPKQLLVDVYTAPDQWVRLSVGQALDGGDVLPGFTLPLAKLFAPVVKPGTTGKKKGPRGKNGKKGNDR
jgi:hypothetical protein